MTAMKISLDDILSDIDDNLQETDTTYVGELAEKICGGKSVPLSDGDTIRRDGIKMSVGSVIQDILDAIGEMEPEDVARIASEILTPEFEVGEDGAIYAKAGDETPSP